VPLLQSKRGKEILESDFMKNLEFKDLGFDGYNTLLQANEI